MPTDVLNTIIIPIALRLLAALLIYVVGRWIALRIRGWLQKSLAKTTLTESFIRLITTLTYYGLLILLGVIILGVLGVPTNVLVAGVTIVLVILAISLQQSLGNLAATTMFMLFKPFEVGDVIESGGILGIVQEIQMFSTILAGPDGKTHILPNGKIQAAGLTNYSTSGRLRVDLKFGISYDSDVERAKTIILDVLAADERVLKVPQTQVFVQQLGDSSIVLVAWPFVEIANYLALQTNVVERVKNEFDKAGISIPFPQQDVHLYPHN